MDTTTTTTAAVVEPEFVRPSYVAKRYSLKRGALYRLLASGAVRSVSLRERGKLRGCRLVDHASLRAYLFKRASGGQANQD